MMSRADATPCLMRVEGSTKSEVRYAARGASQRHSLEHVFTGTSPPSGRCTPRRPARGRPCYALCWGAFMLDPLNDGTSIFVTSDEIAMAGDFGERRVEWQSSATLCRFWGCRTRVYGGAAVRGVGNCRWRRLHLWSVARSESVKGRQRPKRLDRPGVRLLASCPRRGLK